MTNHPKQHDAEIIRMRCDGLGWREIGRRLGRSYESVRQRGFHIGANELKSRHDGGAYVKAIQGGQPAVALMLVQRQCLPAGDPLTWGLLTAGTMLEGTPWPAEGGGAWR